MFVQQHLSRIVQSVVALVLLILTITHWSHNKIGQNIINLQTACMWAIGLEQLTLVYRWIINKHNNEYELSLLFMTLFITANLFEKYHPTEQKIEFNYVCLYSVGTLLAVNSAFLVFSMVVLILYGLRQIYRLMTQTLLTANANLQPSELNQILNMKKPYQQIEGEYQQVSKTCSICLVEFQPETPAIMLPGCEHCFHQECIEKWLQAKSTCPYCRNNIRLNLI